MKETNEIALKAIEYAKNLSETLMTISTGIITITITFTKDFLPATKKLYKKYALIGWLILLLSIISGLFHIMSLTGVLDSYDGADIKIEENARFFMKCQFILFILGIASIIMYASKGNR